VVGNSAIAAPSAIASSTCASVASSNQLLPIRQMEVNKALAKVKADASLGEADKKAQLAELQKEFDELGKKIAALK
jgi:hypothetical protein